MGGMSMFHSDYLPKLAALLEEYELLPIINEQAAHCDDISMMLSMAMLNEGKRYLLGIDYILITEYSKHRKQAALTDTRFIGRRYLHRSECLTMIMNQFITINTKHKKSVVNPIVSHDRDVDTYSCHECDHCDSRACWFKEDGDIITRMKVNYWERKKGTPSRHESLTLQKALSRIP